MVFYKITQLRKITQKDNAMSTLLLFSEGRDSKADSRGTGPYLTQPLRALLLAILLIATVCLPLGMVHPYIG